MAAAPSLRPGPYGLLLVSVIASVFVQGALPASNAQEIVMSVLLGANLLLAFGVAGVRRRRMRLAVAVATVGVAVNVVQAFAGVVGDGEVRALNAVVVLFAPPAIALGVIRSLRASREVRIDAVSGVLSLYMLLGMLFAFVYGAVDHLGGDPFFANDQSATVARCVYFSFVTLATVGYGDVVARSDFGHTLSVFEALLGQIYLVTVVSLIVSNLGRRNGPARSSDQQA
jgi:hypothetical protein